MVTIYSIENFKDLCTEIEVAEIRIEGYEGQRKALMKLLGAPQEIQAMQYSDMPKGTHNYMSIDRLADSINRLDNLLFLEDELLKGMIATKVKINDKLKGLEGIQYKIVYKREIENKSFERIGEEINYSSRQARRIYEETENKHVTKCQ